MIVRNLSNKPSTPLDSDLMRPIDSFSDIPWSEKSSVSSIDVLWGTKFSFDGIFK